MIDFSPLWPLSPPPRLSRSAAVVDVQLVVHRDDRSSGTLKKSRSAVTGPPERFMKDIGLASTTRCPATGPRAPGARLLCALNLAADPLGQQVRHHEPDVVPVARRSPGPGLPSPTTSQGPVYRRSSAPPRSTASSPDATLPRSASSGRSSRQPEASRARPCRLRRPERPRRRPRRPPRPARPARRRPAARPASASTASVVPFGSAMSPARTGGPPPGPRPRPDGLGHVGRLGLDREAVQHVLEQVAARGQLAGR